MPFLLYAVSASAGRFTERGAAKALSKTGSARCEPVADLALGAAEAPIVRARMPERLPVALSRDEVAGLLRRLSWTMHLIVMLLYGAGLRLEECLDLRVKDIDFERDQIVVRRGKGQKDRVTVLPLSAKDAFRAHLDDVRRLHATDCENGYGRVVLPFAVARKYPSGATGWRWQFVFPVARICRDPRFGAPSRYHLHESAVQKAVARAARAAGDRQAGGTAYAAALLCDASAGIRV